VDGVAWVPACGSSGVLDVGFFEVEGLISFRVSGGVALIGGHSCGSSRSGRRGQVAQPAEGFCTIPHLSLANP
jgi:hypothetical protein